MRKIPTETAQNSPAALLQRGTTQGGWRVSKVRAPPPELRRSKQRENKLFKKKYKKIMIISDKIFRS
jgi:hypothetical protein